MLHCKLEKMFFFDTSQKQNKNLKQQKMWKFSDTYLKSRQRFLFKKSHVESLFSWVDILRAFGHLSSQQLLHINAPPRGV